jgi:hypothetical protein
LDGKNIEEIRDFLEGEMDHWLGTTIVGEVGLAATDWTLEGLFLRFTTPGIGSDASLHSGFVGLAVLLVAVILVFLSATVTD